MTRHIRILILGLMTISSIWAKSIQYTLSMPEPHTHLFEVEMRLDGSSGSEIVAMPVWTPGSYLVREYAKNVQDLSARSEDGSPLEFRKLDKNHWEIRGKRRQDIIVTYKVYAFEHSVRTSFLDADHALVNAASVLMYWEKNQKHQHVLKLNLPENWDKISTSLKPFNVPGNTRFVAENYDELVDSPLELGNHHIIEFEVQGKPHVLAIYGESNYVDSVLVADFTKIMEAEAEIFGELPYEHYAFIIHAQEGRGGLEHLNSSVNFIHRWSFNNESKYKSFLALISHEFFHLWNVKRIYPQSISTFDYDHENYLDELWVAEGFTSYYDELILQRVGISDKSDYLKVLKDEVNTLESRPGKNHQSVADASWDAWIKYYRKNEHSRNSTISYYNKGHLLALLLDLKIIAATGGQKSLDDVMRLLYQEYALKNKGFTSRDVQDACESVGDLDLKNFFDTFVFGVYPLPYAEIFDLAGVVLDSSEEKSAYMGATLSESGGKIIIRDVVEEGPAWKAGLNVNDELVAMDGFRVSRTFPQYLGEKVPGDIVLCTVSRNGVLKEFPLSIGFTPLSIVSLTQVDEPTDSQKRVFEKWLGLPWDDERSAD